MHRISIIIPNYNCSQWLPKVIKSCLIQKYLYEIIVVDDNSTDNSWEILNELQNKYSEIIKIFKNPQKGGNNARNFGFSKSTGDYIQWLDADDFLLEGKFENQIKKFEENTNIDVVYSDWYMDFYENNSKFVKRKLLHKKNYNDFLFEIISDNWSAPNNYLFKRKIAQKLNNIKAWNPNTVVAQDREYITMAALLGAKFSYTKGFFSIYNRWNTNSVSSMNFKKRLQYQLELERKFRKRVIENNYAKKSEKKYLALLNSHTMNACFYNPKLKIFNSFSFFNINWKIIHWKKHPVIPFIYIWQHLKYFFKLIKK
jgi:glycosyltransferase involved in cell wall biosynthesis